MAGRAKKRASRTQAFHTSRVADAATPREALWRACSWLVAEAWRSGRLDEATEAVLLAVYTIREGETA